MSKELTRAERIEMLEHDAEATAAAISALKREMQEGGEKPGKHSGKHEDTSEKFNAVDLLIKIDPASTAGVGGSTLNNAAVVDGDLEVVRRREEVRVNIRIDSPDTGSELCEMFMDLETANLLADALKRAAR